MYELVKSPRHSLSSETSLRRYDDLEEAKREAETRRQADPAHCYLVFEHVSPFCRLLNYYTLI